MIVVARPVPLTPKQARVYELIVAYEHVTHQAMPAKVIAERLGRHHSTVLECLNVLYEKGWLKSPGTPATLRPHSEIAS